VERIVKRCEARAALLAMSGVVCVVLGLYGCSADTSAAASARKEYRPPRVETTGSLISHAVVAHVDDDDDDASEEDVAHRQNGANSVSQMLNGNSAAAGTRAVR